MSPPWSIETIGDSVRWLGIRHATDDTHIRGEFWRVFGEGDDWEQGLYYLSALEAYSPAGQSSSPQR